MAAFIPSRRDPQINETALAKVREDKLRESGDGFDGTWVAHPDLVPVALQIFDEVLGDRPNQLDKLREDVEVEPGRLLDVGIAGSSITEAGLRQNISVGVQYLESWLRGVGAAAIFNLMEDAATCEISRSQIWQWVRNGARLQEGPTITEDLVKELEDEEIEKLREGYGDETFAKMRFAEAREVFDRVALSDAFEDFLTLPAYDLLD
jgi:malate synthase